MPRERKSEAVVDTAEVEELDLDSDGADTIAPEGGSGAQILSEPEPPPPPAPTPDEENPRAAQPLVVERPAGVPSRRNLAGDYVCVTCVSLNGRRLQPGATLRLDNDTARHYLKANAVKALED